MVRKTNPNKRPRKEAELIKESVAIKTVMDKLPTSELDEMLNEFLFPFTRVMPDARLGKVVPLAVRGIVCGETPVITAMAQWA